MNDELIAFMRGRLDEDEAAAMAAAGADGKFAGRPGWSALGGILADSDDPDWAVADLSPFIEDPQVAAHIARHDPARVLREVAANRAIVDDCAHWCEGIDNHVDSTAGLARDVLECMAAVYSDHPDYREEWRP